MSIIAEKITSRQQNTLGNAVSFSGIGIHTGKVVTIRFCPAEPGTGVVFKRVDLPDAPKILANLDSVLDTARSTTIGIKDVRIHTVEHVLAAVRAYNIDNLIIEIDSIEPPVGNGSSDVFVKMIEEAGVIPQVMMITVLKLKEPIYYSEKDIHIVGLPFDGYKISYTLSYPNSKVLKAQYFSTEITPESFKKELSPCRTFSQYEEVEYLMDRGLIKGGSLDNAVIIKDNAVFSKEGLFFQDEMVRHKILDMVGDLKLVGFDFHAHIISIRSGHHSNNLFAQKLFKTLKIGDPS